VPSRTSPSYWNNNFFLCSFKYRQWRRGRWGRRWWRIKSNNHRCS
jgi:hypothetical protein